MAEAYDVEKPSVELANNHGWMNRKLDVGPGGKGWLDQLFLGDNNSHFIVEFKDEGVGDSGLSPKQIKRINRLRRMGHRVYVCDDYDQFRTILANENLKRSIKKSYDYK